MSAEEIDGIMRLLDFQLNNTGTNPFAEDFYFIMSRCNGEVPLHKPLFDATAKPVTRKFGMPSLAINLIL